MALATSDVTLANQVGRRVASVGIEPFYECGVIAIKAWNLYRKGKSIPRYLHWHAAKSEAFPKVS